MKRARIELTFASGFVETQDVRYIGEKMLALSLYAFLQSFAERPLKIVIEQIECLD